MEFKDLENVLLEQISALNSVSIEPNDAAEYEMLSLDYTEKDNRKWVAWISEVLKTARTFEIHCWNEETEWIELALRFGERKDADWRYGKVVTGLVTPEFIQILLTHPKPTDTEIYNKMTPFFTIALDHVFWSAHYGTELSILDNNVI